MNKILTVICMAFIQGEAMPTFNFLGNNGTLAFDKSTSSLLLANNISGFNGKLKLYQPPSGPQTGIVTTSTSNTITVDGGSVIVGTNVLDLQGNATYSPASSVGQPDTISLGNGQILSVSAGTILYNNVNVSASSTATVIGTPLFLSDINMAASSSVLNLGLEHRLNKNIVLNGGKLVLLDDLELQDGVRLKFGGTVDVNKQSFMIGSSGASNPWTGTYTFWRADDIQLLGPTTLVGTLFFQTNGTDNVSILNGNGNVMVLSGLGKIKVGDSAGTNGAANGSHTLYINDVHLKGLQDSYFTVPVNMTLAQFTGLSGIAGSTGTAYTNANADGFTVLATTSSVLSNYNSIAISDSTSVGNATTPYVYGTTKTNVFNRSPLNAAPNLTAVDGTNDYLDVDIGVDGVGVAYEGGSNLYVSMFGALPSTMTRTVISAASTYKAVTIGDVNNIYAVNVAGTGVDKYSGAGTSWTSFATGYTNIVDIAASSDGVVWILDNQAGTYKLYKQSAAGAIGTATLLSLPTSATGATVTPTTYNSSRNALCVKGSSTSLYSTYCGSDGHVYFSVDGVNYDVLDAPSTYGAKAAAVGAMGTIAVLSPDDSALPGYAAGLAVFVRPQGNNKFDLYGNTTSGALGQVVLSNVTLELKGNYTHGQTVSAANYGGKILVRGNNCTLISGGNKNFNITFADTPLTVDSVALVYETLGGNNVSPFASSTQAPTLTNGGVVRSVISTVVTVDTSFDANVTPTPSALTKNYSLFTPYTSGYDTFSNRIVVSNSAALSTPKSITIDGGNYYWYFPSSGAGLVIDHDTTVTLKNVTLKNFSLSSVAFNFTANNSSSTPITAHGSGATLVFGDGCVVELAADQTLAGNGTSSTATDIFNFAPTTGNSAKIRGQGQTLNLTQTQSLMNSGVGTLFLENLNIKTSVSPTTIACTNVAKTGTIQLSNCNLIMDNSGLNFTQGNLKIDGWTRVRSANTNTSSTAILSLRMTNSPVQSLTINSGSVFEIDRNCTLNYACGTKGQFVFTDNSSTLYFNSSNLDSTSNSGIGVTFSQGNVLIDNAVGFTASTTAGQEIEISAAANFEVLAAGTLQVTGNVKYTT